MSREPKSMIWCESLTQRTNVSRVSLLRDKESRNACRNERKSNDG